MAQQRAHQTINGTNIQNRDLYASSTISENTSETLGPLLEILWKRNKPIYIEETKKSQIGIKDYDQIIMTVYCQDDSY